MALPNFTQYQPPGVYWAQTSLPNTSTSPGLPNGVAIVGPSVGYRTYSQTLTLPIVANALTIPSSQPGVPQYGIITSSIAIANPAGGVYVGGNGLSTSGTDYVYAQTGSGTTATTQIALGTTGAITGAVTITYNYVDTSFNTPTMVSDAATAAAIYGPATTNIGTSANPNYQISSPITLAASMAFDNGARNVWMVNVPWSDSTNTSVTINALNTAVNSLSAVDGVSIVVPLPVGLTVTTDIQSVAQNLSTYLTNQVSLNNVFQYGMFGWETGTTITNPTTVSSYSGVANPRLSVIYPGDVTWYNNGKTQTIGGYYLAASLAGVLARNPIQQGLTKQVVNDISGIDPVVFQNMTTTNKNTWSAGGVLVVELTRQGQMQVRHGVTSVSSTASTGTIYNREISLVRTQDDMIDTIYQTVTNSGLIGTPITGNTPSVIAGMVNIVLASLQLSGVISSFGSITVAEASVNPTVMNVTFVYVPAYPLNYITVTFGIDTSTGSLTGASTGSNSTGTIVG